MSEFVPAGAARRRVPFIWTRPVAGIFAAFLQGHGSGGASAARCCRRILCYTREKAIALIYVLGKEIFVMKKPLILFLAVLTFLFVPFSAHAQTAPDGVTLLLAEYEETLPSYWAGGGQCYGFVKSTYQQLFGVTVSWSYNGEVDTEDYLYCVDSVTNADDVAALYAKAVPGDILCWSAGGSNPHSTIVYDTSGEMVVLDANSNGAGIIKINDTYTLAFMTNWLATGRTRRISLFRLSPGNVTVENQLLVPVGEKYQIELKSEVDAYVQPEWQTDNTTIATVSEDGIVTAHSAGTVTITCVYANREVNCVVTTYDHFEMDPTLEMTPSALFSRSEHQLTILLNDRTEYANEIEWTSSDPSVATVSASGLVVARKEGNATVLASFSYKGETYQLTCDVQVKKA